jgi:predicted MFS family arabinose efflux permease
MKLNRKNSLEKGSKMQANQGNSTTAAQTDVQPYRWAILTMVAATFILTFLDRFVWPPLIPVVVPVLGINMSQAGAYMSAFYIGYVLTQVPAGVLTDFVGVRLILTLSLIIEGVTTFSMGSITTYSTGFALRVMTGIGAGAVFGACTRAVMEWFPSRERGTAMGVLLASPSSGIVLASLSVPHLNVLLGWQGAFRVVGVVTAAAGALVFFLVRTSSTAKMGSSIIEGFKVVLGSKDLILTACCGFSLMWCEISMATWTFAHIKNLGMSLVGPAWWIMILYGIGGVLGPVFSGVASDKLGGRKQILILALAVTAPVTVIFGYQTSIYSLWIVGFIFGFVSYTANPHLTVLISEFAGQQYAAMANGTSNFIFQLASIIGPWVMGLAIDITKSFHSVWWIMALGPIVGILLLIPVNPKNIRA